MTVLSNEEHHLSQKRIFGWANTHSSHSTIAVPETTEAVCSIIEAAKQGGRKVLGRGAGRSYGDQSLNSEHVVIDMSKMNRILEWDEKSGLLRVQSGVTYDQVLARCLGSGWTLAVVPGTRFVTMGGALANNVHGKNSYRYGNFGEWVREFNMVLASNEHCTCSKKINSELFFAVIGGAGLFGIVTEMILQLVRVSSPYLSVKKTTASCLNELMDQLDRESKKNDYVIAQVDCFPKHPGLGRGTIHSGKYISSSSGTGGLEEMRVISKRMYGFIPKRWIIAIGRYILNDYSMRWVSRIKYFLDKITSSENSYEEDIFHFTFLLDNIPDWSKIFRHGFFEYQPLIPKEKAKKVITELIALTHRYRMPAYLSAIKVHRRDDFLLSYSLDGYSFALDIPRRPKQKEKQDQLFREMNKIVIQARGIVYLAKDATLNPDEFKQMYKKIDQFLALKAKHDPDELFQSDMYRRIFYNNKI